MSEINDERKRLSAGSLFTHSPIHSFTHYTYPFKISFTSAISFFARLSANTVEVLSV